MMNTTSVFSFYKLFFDKKYDGIRFYISIIPFLCVLVHWLLTKKWYNLPPGPRGFPILGYLPLLGKQPHEDFDRLSKQYGSIFGLYLGRVYTVLLSDYHEIKEVLCQKPIMGRPPNQFGFTPDGGGLSTLNLTSWKEQRLLTVRFGLRNSKWETMIQEELDDLLNLIENQNGEPLNYAKSFSESISNDILMLVFGKRIPVGHPTRRLVDRTIELTIDNSRITMLRNVFPTMANFFDKFGIGEQSKDLRSNFAKFTSFLRNEMDERKKLVTNEETKLFVDEYLKEIEDNITRRLHKTFDEGNFRGTTLSLLVGGSDTIAASIMWLMIAMVKYPDIQEKVHQEVFAVLGNDGRAKYSERDKMPYTYAVTLECSRWRTILPLSVARMALKDTKIGNYDIPEGTMIIANLWSIHKSSAYWNEPEELIPERFLTEDGQLLTGNMDGFLPFSYGKRNCPGETVGKITIFQYFAEIMRKFKVLPPVGQNPKLEGKPELTCRPVDQELRFVLRELAAEQKVVL